MDECEQGKKVEQSGWMRARGKGAPAELGGSGLESFLPLGTPLLLLRLVSAHTLALELMQ